jgi:predicted ATPase
VTQAHGSIPDNVKAQNREMAHLSERVQTAEATAKAANAVVDKYEREILMLRAALDVHTHEFQSASDEPVHASLILALAQVGHNT